MNRKGKMKVKGITYLLMSSGVKTTSRFLFRVSLTPNLSCAIINYVEIEVICPLLKRGKNHKGLGKISTSKNYIPPY